MTIHIITKIPVNTASGEFRVQCDSDSISIAHINSGISISSRLSDIASFKGGVIVHWSTLYGFVLSEADSLINDKELAAYLNSVNNIEKDIASIVLNNTGTEAAAVFYAPIVFDGTALLSDKHCSTAEAVDLVFPGSFEQRMRFRKSKIGLLRKVGAHDSLSALEKQVDLLSELVIQIADLIPGSENTPLISKVRQLIDQSSANRGKTNEQVLEKILEFKRGMRNAQASYFEQRDVVS